MEGRTEVWTEGRKNRRKEGRKEGKKCINIVLFTVI